MVGKTQYSPLYNYKVASIGFYSPVSLVLRLKVFFNNAKCYVKYCHLVKIDLYFTNLMSTRNLDN